MDYNVGGITIFTLGGYMNSIFEEIWATSLADMYTQRDGEEGRIYDILEKHEDKLKEALDDDMKEVLEKYSYTQNESAVIYGKQCFFAGMRFATKYLIEAIYG